MANCTNLVESNGGGSLYGQLSSDPVETLLEDSSVLAVIEHDVPCTNTELARYFRSGLPCLGGQGQKEVWRANGPVESGLTGVCYWSESPDYLFAGRWLPQTGSDIVRQAYGELLALAKQRDFPYLVRFWNYIADINQGMSDQEHYRQFCLGRHYAFMDSGYENKRFPAATAVGHRHGDGLICMLASRAACDYFENPRQVSAYNYPREYGPKSPSFARASFNEQMLFISGTASIVGHETQKTGDLPGQIDVTVGNISELLNSIRAKKNISQELRPDKLKVYLRNADDFVVAGEQIQAYFGTGVEIFYVQADICRAELLVEIEGICVL